jgi:glyoxylase-like metal-dependent hydrolase (beta-lactamase superfamily II)
MFPILLTVALAGAAAATASTSANAPVAVIDVAPGIQLLRGRFVPDAQPDGNTIVLRGPQGLVVVDTGRHPAHAQRIVDLAKAARQPVVAIINTHWHLDHVGGNVVLRRAFPNVRVYASTAIEGAMTGFLGDYRKYLEGAVAKEADPAKQKPLRAEMALIDAKTALAPDEKIMTAGPRTIAGRPLELGLEQAAVTAGDVWVFDRKTKTLISGDLVTLPAPLMDTACPAGWKKALDHLDAVPFERLVPGHGPVLTRAQFETYRHAFGELVACGESSKTKTDCIDGWLRDAEDLVPAGDHAFARSLVDYYVDASLRGDPAKTADLCRVPDPAAH